MYDDYYLVFISTDKHIFLQQKVLYKNLFNDIMTPYSKYKLSQLFKGEIFKEQQRVSFYFSTYKRWNKSLRISNCFKVFKANCECIKIQYNY